MSRMMRVGGLLCVAFVSAPLASAQTTTHHRHNEASSTASFSQLKTAMPANWEPNDSGPDQCSGSTPTGRWKSDGNGGCYWEPNDSGPDQCVPPHASLSIGNSVREGFRLVGLLGRLTSAPIFKQPAPLATRVRQPSLSTGSKVVEQGQRSTAQPTDPSANSVRRNGTKAPHPYATSTQEILENVIAAFWQTRLGESAKDPRLGDRASELRVRRLLDVKSLTTRPWTMSPPGDPFGSLAPRQGRNTTTWR
jgi:hypothetical protein